jgi:hypothetical protein
MILENDTDNYYDMNYLELGNCSYDINILNLGNELDIFYF